MIFGVGNIKLLCSIIDPPFDSVEFGIPTISFGQPVSPDTLRFQLSYRDEMVTSIFLHWSTLGGPTIGSRTLDPSTDDFVIEGLSPDTTYNISAYLENACGSGPIKFIMLTTGSPNGPNAMTAVSTTTTTATIATTASISQSMNPTSTVEVTPGEFQVNM